MFFEGDVREDFVKLTWEEISGVISYRNYMTWGRETRLKWSKRVKIQSKTNFGFGIFEYLLSKHTSQKYENQKNENQQMRFLRVMCVKFS